MSKREDRIHTTPDGGQLKRQANGIFRVRFELAESDTNLLEQFLVENDLMDDVPTAMRMMLLATIRDPRWAQVMLDRRRNIRAFRIALWSKMQTKFEELQQEMRDELALLEAEGE